MKLLVFAHRGEAQAFFNQWEFAPVEFYFNGLFKTKNYYLLITGEGLKDASEKTVAVIANFKEELDEVINIGIAGSLSPKLKIGDTAWVRSSYAQNAERCEFKSFTTTQHSSLDCISAYSRVTTLEEKKMLSSFADMVDRELWSIMSAAHLFDLPAFALKLISDEAESDDFCRLVKEEAPALSKKMLQAFLEREEKMVKKAVTIVAETLEDKLLTHPKLYFTTSQARKLHTVLRGLSIKKTMSDDEIMTVLSTIIEGEGLERTPKELSKLLLMRLDQKLNPLNTKIKEKITQNLKPLMETGAQVSFDPELEQDYVQLNFQIRNTKDQKKLILALEQFNYQKIKEIFQGNLGDDV
ncbi:hypothetical protein C0V70_12780 [Bacteriovorax stolpii]|uniref:Uncharacterized protein n=1 Tax=Bacteriovorax stolpii TaxID=960 RepID=A0A2K9NTV9_BACTC|nr:hypothetical protein [Bacteriovorax stolpii]AUN98959.1 hypothetical protein C0V70_12780 [Bacteriovorax stolpii]TDP55518.1 nucleoside phosphorylase [Bacteriovorax stolpii]